MTDDLYNIASAKIDLGGISTPREKCSKLRTGRLDRIAVEQAESMRFDQMPVIDDAGRLCGLVSVEHARDLVERNQPLTPTDPLLRLKEVSEEPTLFDLLAALSEERAVIYRNTFKEEAEDWFGLVTISDLNRHTFRSYLYPLLAELEAEMAQFIESRFDDHMVWLDGLQEYSQIGVVGRWDFARRKGVDTTLVAGCQLSDLMEIVGKRKDFVCDLAFSSKTEFDAFAKAVKDLRNDVMHAVKPLVWKTEHVAKMRNTLRSAVATTEKLNTLNSRSLSPIPPAE